MAGFRNAWAALFSEQDRNRDAYRVSEMVETTGNSLTHCLVGIACFLSCLLDFGQPTSIERLLWVWTTLQLHGMALSNMLFLFLSVPNPSCHSICRRIPGHFRGFWTRLASALSLRPSGKRAGLKYAICVSPAANLL